MAKTFDTYTKSRAECIINKYNAIYPYEAEPTEDFILELVNDLPQDQINTTVKGKSILHRACTFGHDRVVSTLLKVPNIDINLSDNNGYTPLMQGIKSNNNKITDLLLERKELNINAQDVTGATALMEAVYENNYKIIEKILLTRKDIDPNIQDTLGNTVLDRSKISKRCIPIINLLINNGIN